MLYNKASTAKPQPQVDPTSFAQLEKCHLPTHTAIIASRKIVMMDRSDDTTKSPIQYPLVIGFVLHSAVLQWPSGSSPTQPGVS